MATEFAWINRIHVLADEGRRDAAIDLLYRSVDDLLRAGKFSECDAALRRFDLDRLSIALLVGLLSITLSAAALLPGRAELVERVEARLMVLAPDQIVGLMQGLR